MSRIPIKEFCEQYGQKAAADIIGCTQGNISQIITEGRREIYFEKDGDLFTWIEVKRTKKGAAAA